MPEKAKKWEKVEQKRERVGNGGREGGRVEMREEGDKNGGRERRGSGGVV